MRPPGSRFQRRATELDWAKALQLGVLRAAVIPMLLLAGCATPVGFDQPAEVKRQDAIIEAAATRDTSPATMRGLIEQLDSFDPATRMLAILTLQRLTGETFGYDYSEPSWKREPAVEAWVSWYHVTYGTGAEAETSDG